MEEELTKSSLVEALKAHYYEGFSPDWQRFSPWEREVLGRAMDMADDPDYVDYSFSGLIMAAMDVPPRFIQFNCRECPSLKACKAHDFANVGFENCLQGGQPVESSWQEGDKAIVYSDPLTETKAEGEVVLMEKLDSIESGLFRRHSKELERWRVIFLADAFKTTRFIKPKDQSHQER